MLRSAAPNPAPPVTTSSSSEPGPVEAPTLRREQPALGIGLILAATVFLACSDTTAKYLATSLPAIVIAWIRYFVFFVILLPAVAYQGPAKALRSARPGLQLFRGFGLV